MSLQIAGLGVVEEGSALPRFAEKGCPVTANEVSTKGEIVSGIRECCHRYQI